MKKIYLVYKVYGSSENFKSISQNFFVKFLWTKQILTQFKQDFFWMKRDSYLLEDDIYQFRPCLVNSCHLFEIVCVPNSSFSSGNCISELFLPFLIYIYFFQINHFMNRPVYCYINFSNYYFYYVRYPIAYIYTYV